MRLCFAEGSFCGGIWFLQAPTPTEKKPRVIGGDFSGVVRAVGRKVTKFKVGDAVCGINVQPMGQDGSWSEQLITAQDNILPIPDEPRLSFAEWAATTMPAFVATSMFKAGALEQGNVGDTASQIRCLVVGASGGIGSFLVQLLSAQSNVHVTGVCGPKNVDFVRQLGAEEVFDYTKGSLTEQLEQSGKGKFDRVFDLVGGSDIEEEAYSDLLDDDGHFVTAVGPSKYIGDSKMSVWEQVKYTNHVFVRPYAFNLFSKKKYHLAAPMALPEDMFQQIVDLKVKPVIDRIVPFNKTAIAEAIELVKSHHAKGRVVLAIDPDCTQLVGW